MGTWIGGLEHFVSRPIVTLVVGGALFLSSLEEAMQGFIFEAFGLEVGAHHGIVIFGLAHALKGLGELFEARRAIARNG